MARLIIKPATVVVVVVIKPATVVYVYKSVCFIQVCNIAGVQSLSRDVFSTSTYITANPFVSQKALGTDVVVVVIVIGTDVRHR